MSPEQHQRMRQIFDEALERPEGDRLAFLESACSGDAEVLEAATRLLDSRHAAESFLEKPAPEFQRLGRYRVTAELGRGAMGVVYEALDPLIGRTVAVKVIHLHLLTDPGEAEFMRERLFREAHSAGTLSHPGIVLIFDVGREGDTPFIAMERVDGPSLEQLLKSGGTLGHNETLDILRQTAAALDYAHQNDVVHRDVKPANIMLHRGTTVKVTDFGIAKIASKQSDTVTGLMVGTPGYMSPEQIESRPVDGKSDQFSLAVVAYQILTRTKPFHGEVLAAVAHAIAYGPRPSARAANPMLPGAVDNVFRRGLARTPAERYGSCGEFVAALDTALKDASPPEGPVNPQSGLSVGGRWRSSGSTLSWLKLFAGGTTLLVLLGAPLGWLLLRPSIQTTARRLPAPVGVPAAHFYDEAITELRAGRDIEAAISFRRAAGLGDPRAMEKLGEMYVDGRGVTRNDSEAVQWFRKAADAGEPTGMLFLGAMYYLGAGVARDYAAAAGWYGKAADAGSPDAMYDLGTLYENGEGVAKDLEKAKQLYRKASELGNADAQKRIIQLRAN
jgi:hypothetical protein